VAGTGAADTVIEADTDTAAATAIAVDTAIAAASPVAIEAESLRGPSAVVDTAAGMAEAT
jgi:hypothetical protein